MADPHITLCHSSTTPIFKLTLIGGSFLVGSMVSLLAPTLSLLANEADSKRQQSPFVVGFERFGVHGDVELAAGGRLLLSELSCTACHATADGSLQAKGGPRLDRVGTRLQTGWLAAYVRSPGSVKPGTTMPDLLHGMEEPDKERTVTALVAYLSSLHGSYPTIKGSGLNPVPHQFWASGDVERGRQLYHSVGCVACHDADATEQGTSSAESPLDALFDQLDAEELEELGLASAARRVPSVPLPDLGKKYSAKSLTHFLYDPEATRPSGRMPNLKLLAVEAADIAAYLMARGGQDEHSFGEPSRSSIGREDVAVHEDIDRALIERGRREFFRLGCASCHETGEPREVADGLRPAPAPELASLVEARPGSCLAEPEAGQPHYGLTPQQGQAIGAAMGSLASAKKRGAAKVVEAELLRLNCFACHEREQLGGVGRYRRAHFETVGNVDLGDEGRLPPPLTGTGRKLKEAWFKQVLAGKGEIRPHMQIRMPRYPAAQVRALPQQFAQADREGPGDGKASPDAADERDVFAAAVKQKISKQALAAAGHRLMDAGCVQCHPFRGYALPGVIGVDLAGIADRVNPDWFHDFVLNPGSLKSRTRMPTFFPDGQSQNKEILDGETELQLAAIWTYLKDLDRQPLPAKIDEVRSQDYELRPNDRPIVLRTFMESAGTHAIAVGFPAGVHLAFDAERMRLAAAWRGRFLDSQGTWFSRFAPPAEPLGEKLIEIDLATPLTTASSPQPGRGIDGSLGSDCRFLGYRLDESGVPTFRYQCGNVLVEDRLSPDAGTGADAERGLKRHLTLRRIEEAEGPVRISYRVLAADEIQRLAAHSVRTEAGLRVEVSAAGIGEGEIRETADAKEWVLPLSVTDELVVEVTYQW